MEIRMSLLLWIGIFSRKSGHIESTSTGVDIGYRCKYDAECIAGNGGEYSKCNQELSICICTINQLGEDKCMVDSDEYDRVCRRPKLYQKAGKCTMECSPKGTRTWRKNEDWYGEIHEYFASFVRDKKTTVCYDPRRAFNSLPDGYEIKRSSIPNAGLGVFTNVYIEQDTVFGPCKGIFEPDTDIAVLSGYSWRIDPRDGEDRADVVWVDSKDVSQSNWVRYVNTPTSAEMENLVPVQYKGEMYYQAFKHIPPGTELLIWYGDSYGEILEIETFEPSQYYHAEPGYVGGACHEDDEGTPCQYDLHTVCADQTCFCLPGTHNRVGRCITDETLGGVCTGKNGDMCKQGTNAECQRGVCVCKNNTTPANGRCILDETFGGHCVGRNGEKCLLDDNTECVNGLCRCKYGTTGINGKCMEDEAYQGRCTGDDGEECEIDINAKCNDKICVCKENATVINGKCELDESAGGKCKAVDGKPCALDKNAVCIKGFCRCKSGTNNVEGECLLDETIGGRCGSEDGIPCKIDCQGICIHGICSCKKGKSDMGGICISDGALSGMCVDGKCYGKNVICDPWSDTCVCPPQHFAYAGKCVKEKNIRQN